MSDVFLLSLVGLRPALDQRSSEASLDSGERPGCWIRGGEGVEGGAERGGRSELAERPGVPSSPGTGQPAGAAGTDSVARSGGKDPLPGARRSVLQMAGCTFGALFWESEDRGLGREAAVPCSGQDGAGGAWENTNKEWLSTIWLRAAVK